MPPGDAPTADSFESEAAELLESIGRARKKVEGIAGVLDGTLDRYRERIDRLLRESEVDNWRQVRIFTRDVETIAADLGKASKEKRLSPRLVAWLDAALRKARRRDFYGARKAWRRLDRIAEQGAEVRRLQARYREAYRSVESRIRQLKTQVERLEKIPKPPTSPEDARAFNESVDRFNEASTAAYLDFLSRARADLALPLLLDAGQGGGIGVPAPPPGSDPDPLMRLLSNASPQVEAFRGRTFYGLLELPGYSDAKLTHIYGDSRLIRDALDEAWSWLKAIREDERRSLQIQWSEDALMLRRRVPSVVAFLERLGKMNDAADRGRELVASLNDGRFESLHAPARLYATHGESAERKWRGSLEKDIDGMRKEAAELGAVLKKFADPAKVESGERSAGSAPQPLSLRIAIRSSGEGIGRVCHCGVSTEEGKGEATSGSPQGSRPDPPERTARDGPPAVSDVRRGRHLRRGLRMEVRCCDSVSPRKCRGTSDVGPIRGGV